MQGISALGGYESQGSGVNDRTKSSGKRPIEQYVCGMLMIIIMNHYISNEKLAAVCCSDDKLNDKLNESQPTGHTVEKTRLQCNPRAL